MAKVGDLRAKCARARAVALKIEELSAQRKGLYAEADRLAHELSQEESPLFGIAIEDSFANGKNTVYGHGPVSRFKIVVLPQKEASGKKSEPPLATGNKRK